jgi:hypothetical protein
MLIIVDYVFRVLSEVFLFMCFSGSTVFNVLRGILEVVIGVATGSLLGFFIQYFPSSDQVKQVIWESYAVQCLWKTL